MSSTSLQTSAEIGATDYKTARARIAVAACFLVNGSVIGGWGRMCRTRPAHSAWIPRNWEQSWGQSLKTLQHLLIRLSYRSV
jgi:hypothetical protein